MNADTISKLKEAWKLWNQPERTQGDVDRINAIKNELNWRHNKDELRAHLAAIRS